MMPVSSRQRLSLTIIFFSHNFLSFSLTFCLVYFQGIRIVHLQSVNAVINMGKDGKTFLYYAVVAF